MLRLVCSALIAGTLVLIPAAFSSHFSDQARAEATEKADKGKAAKAKRPLTAGQKAYHERVRQCGAEWKELNKSGKREKGMTWLKFRSECNKRLKAKSG